MLATSRVAKKPGHSVLQPTKDWEEKANSHAVYTALGDYLLTPLAPQPGRGKPHGSTFLSHIWFQGGINRLQKYLRVP